MFKMSATSADEFHGWLPSPCMTTSRAAGAKRFIGARKRVFRFVDLEEPRPMLPRLSCVWEIAGWSDELAASLGSVQTGVEGRNCDKTASHKGRRRLTRRLFEIVAVLLSPMRLL